MKTKETKKTLEELNHATLLNEDDMLKIKGGGNEDREDILIEE